MERVEISKSGLFIFILALVFLMPSYFSNGILDLVNNGMAVLMTWYLFSRRYRPSRFLALASLYFIYLILITFVRGAGDIHTLISMTKSVFFLACIDSGLDENYDTVIKYLLVAIGTYVILDFLSVILHPNGLYQTTTVWNEWSSSRTAQWIFGNKNNRTCWYMLFVLLMYLQMENRKQFWNRIMLGVSIMISESVMLFVKSSTSIVVITLLNIGVLFTIFKKEGSINIRLKYIVFIYAVAMIMIVTGSMIFLRPIIETLFAKDLTFSSRTIVWGNTLLLIAQRPILGWGNISKESAISALGSVAYVNSHNQWLQTLWQGGIILCILLILIIKVILEEIQGTKSVRIQIPLLTTMLGFLIEIIFEVELSSNITWVMLVVVYCTCRRYRELEKFEIYEEDIN